MAPVAVRAAGLGSDLAHPCRGAPRVDVARPGSRWGRGIEGPGHARSRHAASRCSSSVVKGVDESPAAGSCALAQHGRSGVERDAAEATQTGPNGGSAVDGTHVRSVLLRGRYHFWVAEPETVPKSRPPLAS